MSWQAAVTLILGFFLMGYLSITKEQARWVFLTLIIMPLAVFQDEWNGDHPYDVLVKHRFERAAKVCADKPECYDMVVKFTHEPLIEKENEK